MGGRSRFPTPRPVAGRSVNPIEPKVAGRRQRAPTFRRSPHVVCFWVDDQLVAQHYGAAEPLPVDQLLISILRLCDTWRSPETLSRTLPVKVSEVRRALTRLTRAGLLERSDRKASSDSLGAMSGWSDWNPAAGFFHFYTKNLEFDPNIAGLERALRSKGKTAPPPRAIKQYRGIPQIRLPQTQTEGEFPRVLKSRRTWRKFDARPVALADLSTLLNLSFGVRMHGTAYDGHQLVYTTSPSGGACHPCEAYVLALNVDGLKRGLYHYAADSHRLNVLRTGATRRDVAKYIPTQWWYEPAAAIVFMTAVFPRVQWRYPSPRTYRSVLLAAGHLCQTFCLVATWLGLAPFCTHLVADARLEKDLGVDGVNESFIYAAGVGTRPPGVDWAPWPEHRKGNYFLPPKRRR